MTDDRKQIEHLLKKSDVKEANGMDYKKELIEIFQLISLHQSNPIAHEAYRNRYIQVALSLLNEPLSDIPMGRVVQFLNVFKREFASFKDMYNKYKEKNISALELKEQYERFSSVLKYLCKLLSENGDHETTYIQELDEIPELKDNVLVEVGETDINKYYESLEYAFLYYEYMISFVQKAIDTNDKALLNATSFCIGAENLYVNCIIDFFKWY